MAYPITTTSSTTIASIADGTVNSSATSLTLIGKNYAGYGNFLNENFVHLLENFAYGSAPGAPLTGQLWYDTANSVLKICVNGSNNEWKPFTGVTSQTTEPVLPAPVIGDQWWDQSANQLKVWSGDPILRWVTIGPAFSTTSGQNGAVVDIIPDSNSNNQTVIKFYVNNEVIGIISGNAASFTPMTTISGFPSINPGFNIISSSVKSGSQFTGNAANALTLNGINSNQFLRSDTAATTNYQLGVGNLQVGSDLIITPNSSSEVKISSYSAAKKSIKFYVNSGVTEAVSINGTNAAVIFSNTVSVTSGLNASSTLVVSGAANLKATTTFHSTLLPNAAGTINIGLSTQPFANVHATNFVGNLTATTISASSYGTVTATTVATSGTASASIVTASRYVKTGVFANTVIATANIGSPPAGTIIFSTSDSKFYGYTGSMWVPFN